jgi:hypothetical protein
MSNATGTVTTNYGFKTLDDGDIAGNDGINEVITSIDTNLQNDTFVANMVMLYFGATAPNGWSNINSTIVGLQATASFTGYIWIKKNA